MLRATDPDETMDRVPIKLKRGSEPAAGGKKSKEKSTNKSVLKKQARWLPLLVNN